MHLLGQGDVSFCPTFSGTGGRFILSHLFNKKSASDLQIQDALVFKNRITLPLSKTCPH